MWGTPGYVMAVFDLSMCSWRSFLSLITIRSFRLCRRCSGCRQSFLSRLQWFCRASVPLYLHFIWLNILFSWIGSDSNVISGILYHLAINLYGRLSSKGASTHPLMYVCGMLSFILWFQIMGRGVGWRLIDDHSISSSISSLDGLVGRWLPSKNKKTTNNNRNERINWFPFYKYAAMSQLVMLIYLVKTVFLVLPGEAARTDSTSSWGCWLKWLFLSSNDLMLSMGVE